MVPLCARPSALAQGWRRDSAATEPWRRLMGSVVIGFGDGPEFLSGAPHAKACPRPLRRHRPCGRQRHKPLGHGRSSGGSDPKSARLGSRAGAVSLAWAGLLLLSRRLAWAGMVSLRLAASARTGMGRPHGLASLGSAWGRHGARQGPGSRHGSWPGHGSRPATRHGSRRQGSRTGARTSRRDGIRDRGRDGVSLGLRRGSQLSPRRRAAPRRAASFGNVWRRRSRPQLNACCRNCDKT